MCDYQGAEPVRGQPLPDWLIEQNRRNEEQKNHEERVVLASQKTRAGECGISEEPWQKKKED